MVASVLSLERGKARWWGVGPIIEGVISMTDNWNMVYPYLMCCLSSWMYNDGYLNRRLSHGHVVDTFIAST